MEGANAIRAGSNGEEEHKLLYSSLREGFGINTEMQNGRYLLLGRGETRRVYDTVRRRLTPDYSVPYIPEDKSERGLERRASTIAPKVIRNRR